MGRFRVCSRNGKDPSPERAVRAGQGAVGASAHKEDSVEDATPADGPTSTKGPWHASLHSQQGPGKTLEDGGPFTHPNLSHGLATPGAEDMLAGICPLTCPPGTWLRTPQAPGLSLSPRRPGSDPPALPAGHAGWAQLSRQTLCVAAH